MKMHHAVNMSADAFVAKFCRAGGGLVELMMPHFHSLTCQDKDVV